MALSGLQIFKLLPRTNCKECGFPTCMAFAMQIAAGKAEFSQCPHISPEAAAELGEAVAPPIRKVTIGVGESALVLGEETVLFRHERRFEHSPGLALLLDDSVDDSAFDAGLAGFTALHHERVGQVLRMGLVAVSSAEGSRLAARGRQAAEVTGAPLVLMSDEPEALTEAGAALNALRPLLYAADSRSLERLAPAAVELGLPLALRAHSLEELASLSDRAQALGVKELVLDSTPENLQEALRDQTLIRRSAIKRGNRSLGFPTIAFPCRMTAEPMLQAVFASVFVVKYAGIVVLDTADPAYVLPLLVLAQNIYTDPQRPMQMEEGIYPINDPGPESPVLITTNFSLTYFTVAGEIESSKVPAWLLVMDTEGMSVLTSWAAGKFVADAIAPFVQKSGIEERISHRRLVIPGYVAQISGELEDELNGWQVQVGVREAVDIPRYLRSLATA